MRLAATLLPKALRGKPNGLLECCRHATGYEAHPRAAPESRDRAGTDRRERGSPARSPLRPFVERYIGYRFEGFPSGIHRGLPSRHLTFIVSLRDAIEVTALPGAAGSTGTFAGVLGGLHPGPAMIRHDGNQVGLCIEATPLGARALFGIPAGALASAVVEPHEVLGRGVAALPDRLASATSWPAAPLPFGWPKRNSHPCRTISSRTRPPDADRNHWARTSVPYEAAHSFARFAISSSGTSSTCVVIHHILPAESRTPPERSP